MNVPAALRPIGAGARLGRVRGAGQTGMIFVAAASITRHFPASHLPLLYVLAVLSHAIGNVINDLADLEYDRRDHNRSLRPLVVGDLSVTGTVCLAMSLLVAVTACLAFARWRSWGIGWTLVMMFALIWGNTYQKRLGPNAAIWMDLLFGLGMASPLLICPTLVGTRLTLVNGCLFVSFAAEMMLLNAVAGNLKDLAADERAGIDTTALTLGVTAIGMSQGDYPPAYIRYCRRLQLITWGGVLAAVAVSDREAAEMIAAAAALAVLLVLDRLTLNNLLTGRRPIRSGGSEPYTSIEFLGFLTTAGVCGQPVWLAVALPVAVLTYGLGLLLESLGSPTRLLRVTT